MAVLYVKGCIFQACKYGVDLVDGVDAIIRSCVFTENTEGALSVG